MGGLLLNVLLGCVLFKERMRPLSSARMTAFPIIPAALAVYSPEGLRRAWANRAMH